MQLSTRQQFLRDVLQAIGNVFKSSTTSTGKWEFWETRLLQARNERTIEAFIERLLTAVGGTAQSPENISWLIRSDVSQEDRRAVLRWVVDHPRDSVSLAWKAVKKGEGLEPLDLSGILIPDVPQEGDLPPRPKFDITIELTLTSPLMHGSQDKAGNFTLFRRKRVLTSTGGLVDIPFYAGNALRGQLRDIAAAHFISWLGATPAAWFFHFIFSGGGMAEVPEAGRKKLGETAHARSVEKMREWSHLIPVIGLFGGMLGASSFSGSIDVHDLEVVPGRWALDSHEFLTRRDDSSKRDVPAIDAGENNSMIAGCETLVAGSSLRGGINMRHHISAAEAGLLSHCLRSVQECALGGQPRRGWGRAQWSISARDQWPGAEAYSGHLDANREKIYQLLSEAQALSVPSDAGN